MGRLHKILTVIRNPRSLGEQAMNASLWNVAGLAVQYPLRLGSNLVLTRLLAPEAFGLMAVITTLHIGLMLLSDVGIVQSVIRDRRGATAQFLRVAWTAQILRGAALAVVLLMFGLGVMFYGPQVAGAGTVYVDPSLPWLIWASSLMFIMRGATSGKVLLARRRMRLKGVILVDLVGQVVGIVAMLGFGLWLGTVWALLLGTLLGTGANVIASYVILPGPTMRFVWDAERAAEIWAFGKWIIPASIGGFLLRHGDRLLFSALLDARLFGIYAISIIWVEIGITLLLRVGSSVFMPVFSRLIHEGDAEVLKRHFDKIFLVYSGAAALMFVVYILFIDDMIELLYSADYHAAGMLTALAATRLMFLNAQVINDYVVATGASLYSACANLCAATIAFVCAVSAYTWYSFEAAIVAFSGGSLVLLLLLQVNRSHVYAFGLRRTLPVSLCGAAIVLSVYLCVVSGMVETGGWDCIGRSK